MRYFDHFDFEICFAPQRRAIFHLSSAQMALASLLVDPSELQNIGTRRRMARERRVAGSSAVTIETLYYKTIY